MDSAIRWERIVAKWASKDAIEKVANDLDAVCKRMETLRKAQNTAFDKAMRTDPDRGVELARFRRAKFPPITKALDELRRRDLRNKAITTEELDKVKKIIKECNQSIDEAREDIG